MAITFVDSQSISDNSQVGTSGLVVPVGSLSGAQADDILIIFSHRADDIGTWNGPPTGFTTLFEEVVGNVGSDRSMACYYKIHDGSESDVTLYHTDTGTEEWAAVVCAYRGVDTTTPWDVTYSNASHNINLLNKSSPNVDAFAQITTVTDGAMVLAIEAVTHDDITSNADPSGYTNRHRNIGSTEDWRQIQWWDKIVATAGNETPGAPPYTSGNGFADSSQYTLALRSNGDVNVEVNTDVLTLTEYPASVDFDVELSANTDSLTFTTYAADVSLDTEINANTANFTLVEHPASISLDTEIAVNPAILEITTYPATVSLTDTTAALASDPTKPSYTPSHRVQISEHTFIETGHDLEEKDLIDIVQILALSGLID